MMPYKGLLYLAVYLLGVNLYAWMLMWFDKRSAESGKWRIAEKQLAIVSVFGGVPGALAAMVMFRHKTKHKRFYIGLPVLLLVQSITVIGVLFYLMSRRS